MKKMTLLLALCALCAATIQAQNYYLLNTTPTPSPSASTYELANGNVGIGTTTPTSNLTIMNSSTTNSAILEVDNNQVIGSPSVNAILVNRLKFSYTIGGGGIPTTHTYTDFTVTNAGLTGIGVAAPAAHLDITDPFGDGLPLLQVTPNGSTTPSLYIDGSYGIVSIGAPPTTTGDGSTYIFQIHGIGGCLSDFAVEGDHFVVSDQYVNGDGTIYGSAYIGGTATINGAAGIGSTTGYGTYGKLQVHSSDGINLDLVNEGTSGYGNQINYYDGSNQQRHIIYDDFGPTSGTSASNGDLVIQPACPGSPNGMLWINGKVKIGDVPAITLGTSLATDYSLYVESGIIAEKYKCALRTTSDWSDYVFDKGYKLQPLADVEAYIKANKHLPDVPSAEDVKCEGIDMAKMDATLLRKIEELTLYTLELRKEIEALK